jgi:hypothetical protein
MMEDQRLAEWTLESSQTIQRRLDEIGLNQASQLKAIHAELKSIYWMVSWCALAAMIFVITSVVQMFR